MSEAREPEEGTSTAIPSFVEQMAKLFWDQYSLLFQETRDSYYSWDGLVPEHRAVVVKAIGDVVSLTLGTCEDGE